MYLLAPSKRTALAGALTAAGFTADDIVRLRDYVDGCMGEDLLGARRLLAGILRNLDELRQVIGDIEKHGLPAVKAKAKDHDHGASIRATWKSEADAASIARGLARDGRTVLEIATILGVELDEVAALV